MASDVASPPVAKDAIETITVVVRRLPEGPLADPEAVDGALAAFLSGGAGSGLDQIPWAAYRALVELFDRWWLDGPEATIEPRADAGISQVLDIGGLP